MYFNTAVITDVVTAVITHIVTAVITHDVSAVITNVLTIPADVVTAPCRARTLNYPQLSNLTPGNLSCRVPY